MAMDQNKKRLLVIDDSRIMRRALTGIFSENDHVEVVGEAGDGQEGLEQIEALRPDVVTLDVVMPKMDGLTMLKHMMMRVPTPAVMLSAHTEEGAKITFDALKYGAVDFALKPSRNDDLEMGDQANGLIRKVLLAADMEMGSVRYIRTGKTEGGLPERTLPPCRNVVVIGAGEGGYASLLKIIPRLSPELDTTFLVMIYAPEAYVDAFTSYIRECSDLAVERASDNVRSVHGGSCYISSGEQYMTLHRNGDSSVELHTRPAPFAFRRGSINMLMFSVAEVMKNRSAAVLLSGAGKDGAEGMAEIIRVGGVSVLQEPTNCLYRDMVNHAMKNLTVDGLIADTEMAAMFNDVFNPGDMHA